MRDGLDVLRRLATAPRRDTDYAYRMGYDCGKNGANTTNCHFGIFSTPENTKAWERGKADADAGVAPAETEASDAEQ